MEDLTSAPPLAPKPADAKYGKALLTQSSIVLFCLFLVVGLLAWDAFRPEPKWEYKIDSISDLNFDHEINALGQDGWELVFARRASAGSLDTSSNQKPEFAYEIIFKRKVSIWR